MVSGGEGREGRGGFVCEGRKEGMGRFLLEDIQG